MANNYVHINIRRDTSAKWAANDPVLQLGEIAADMDKHGLKVGDGTHKWSELPFCTAEIINDLITGGTDKALSAEQGKVLKGLVDGKASRLDLTNLELRLTQLINNSRVDVLDQDWTSQEQKKALSANSGRILKGWIDGKASTTDLTNLEQKLITLINGSAVVVEDNLTSQSRVNALSANQGRVLKELVDGKASTTDLTNLETKLIQLINNSTVDVIDNLTSTSTTSALSANQGRILKDLVDAASGGTSVVVEDKLTSTSKDNALSANQGRVLDEKISKLNIFGIGYTVDSFNAYNKPTKITFSDGVTATLTWIGTQLSTIKASTGETITMQYNNDGLIIGRTVTR